MCGIVGVLGKNETAPILLDALKRLEYRGYDSAGITLVGNDGTLSTLREVGKIAALTDRFVHSPIFGKAGIGHTRWATHGVPSQQNAHPHSTERVSLVHNGIIENYESLRKELEAQGVKHCSDTDTETVMHLVDTLLQQGLSPQEAVAKVLKRLEGAYALCFIFKDYDDLIIVARNGAPLAIGCGDGEMFVGSDAAVLNSFTEQIIYLKDGDYAFITRENTDIYDDKGRKANRAVIYTPDTSALIDKAGHKHYMSKEIFEQPKCFNTLLQNYWDYENSCFKGALAELDFSKTTRIQMIGCGTAHIAAMIAQYWFEAIARIPAQVDIASEFRYRNPVFDKEQANIFISQSGETADTLAAMKYCAAHHIKSVGIVNTERSSIARISDNVLPIYAGPEIGVASTKAFTSQLGTLFLTMLKAGLDKGHISANHVLHYINALSDIPRLMNSVLTQSEKINALARLLAKSPSALFLGRGVMYPLALEAALKLKEISYIHAQGLPAGEIKHGPIALVDEDTPIIFFMPSGALYEKTVSNLNEVISRQGRILLIGDIKPHMQSMATWDMLQMPDIEDPLAPILYSLPIQLLAYYTASEKGTDADQPRNLAKSVTVE